MEMVGGGVLSPNLHNVFSLMAVKVDTFRELAVGESHLMELLPHIFQPSIPHSPSVQNQPK